MTAPLSIRDAEAALRKARADHGRGSMRGHDAFQRLCQAYAAQGRRVDELRFFSPDEEERFFAQTAQGPDGHVYWLGAQRFFRNDGAQRRPIRWWWERRFGPLDQGAVVAPMCGERGCIFPGHAAVVPPERRKVSERHAIGALQAAAARLGRAPGMREWRRAKLAPHAVTIVARFGSWPAALAAAGLRPSSFGTPKASPADCVEALRVARRALGHWPAPREMQAVGAAEALAAAGLPRRPGTIMLRLGCSWQEALRKAGKR